MFVLRQISRRLNLLLWLLLLDLIRLNQILSALLNVQHLLRSQLIRRYTFDDLFRFLFWLLGLQGLLRGSRRILISAMRRSC